jgi:hypothetical protein
MTKILDYKLVIEKNTTVLAGEVRDLMYKGYKCLDGVVVQPNPEIKNGFWYIQTMIKE